MKKLFLVSLILMGTGLFSLAFAQKKEKKDELSSSVLTNWINFHCKLVRTTSGMTHVAFSRHFSYTAIAVYESIVESNSSYRSLSGQLIGLKTLPALPGKKMYWPASLNASYAAMLREFYSSFGVNTARIDSMEQAQKLVFEKAGVASQKLEQSSLYGQNIASAIIDWAKQDGHNISKDYVPEKGEGLWSPTPPAFAAANVPYWWEKRSFTNNLLSLLTIQQPVYSADSAAAFYKMAKEVYDVSRELSPQQKATALYWDDAPNGKYITVFGHWTSILSGLIQSHKLPLLKAAEVYAAMAISMHEASLLAWKGKYQYKVVRPVTYIQQHIDKNWMPLIATPPHPEFPAAHATLSNAAATALCAFFGESCAMTDNSYTDIGMPERKYSSLQEAAREAGYSRLYGGIHYRHSIEEGFTLGASAAKQVLKEIVFSYPPVKELASSRY